MDTSEKRRYAIRASLITYLQLSTVMAECKITELEL